jgi:hypothetical protein
MQRWPIGEECRYDGQIHPFVAELPKYHLVPKERGEHLAFRIRTRKWAENSKARQAKIREWCAADPLFFINVFCWIIEPREDEEQAGRIPFCTWKHQDPVIASIAKHFGKRHIVGDKSRAQGASWIVVALFVWRFLFFRYQNLGMGSKNKDYADNPKKHASLGFKIDFLLKNLPEWMLPNYDRMADGHWLNRDNHSMITAEPATEDMGRGDRYTAFALDEAAYFPNNYDRMAVDNLVATTNGIIMISTPNGMDNEHYDRISIPSPWLRVVLDWKDNPEHNQGLYTNDAGKLRIMDKGHQFPSDYTFYKDDRIRSPWYDRRWDDMKGNPVAMSREYDRDYGGSKSRPFPPEDVNFHRQFNRTETMRGTLILDHTDPSNLDGMRFVQRDDGPLKLWVKLDSEGLPLTDGALVQGCDIGTGTGGEGTSNSTAIIWSSSGEQIAEFADNNTGIEDFCRTCIALCYWFGRGDSAVYLIFEKNGGTGAQYTKELKRWHYPNRYKLIQNGKRTNIDGYHNSKRSVCLTPLAAAMSNRRITILSKDLLRETGEYVYGKNGEWEHPKSSSSQDPANAGLNHGDRTMAAAMCMIGLEDRGLLPDYKPPKNKKLREQDAPPDSVFGRARARKQAEEEGRLRTSCVW